MTPPDVHTPHLAPRGANTHLCGDFPFAVKKESAREGAYRMASLTRSP
jgi:hypothetical protein